MAPGGETITALRIPLTKNAIRLGEWSRAASHCVRKPARGGHHVRKCDYRPEREGDMAQATTHEQAAPIKRH